MKHLWTIASIVTVTAMVGCASQETNSAQSREKLEKSFEAQIGTATKSDFIEKFGPAQWCRPQGTGNETCRFSRKVGQKWVGDKNDKTDRKRVEQFDNVVTEFDGNGKLRSYEVDTQR